MDEHTRGRLKVTRFGECTFIDTEDTEESNGLRIADCQGDDLLSPETCRENGRRLVACWNACEAFTTEAIEGGIVARCYEESFDLDGEGDESPVAP